jgi:prolyl oligopeptidase
VTQDPYLWLEEVEGERALDWVRARNAESAARLETDPRYESVRARAEAILAARDRIPYGEILGESVHNFWQDDRHVRGLWRRTSVAGYESASTVWDTVLDIDALAEREDENWVYQGRSALPPEYTRFMLRLSRGGSDAAVLREFDLPTLAFVDDGFVLEEAKQSVAWIDRDALLVATPLAGGSLNSSGYARSVRIWRRGDPLRSAEQIFEGEENEVGPVPAVFHRPEGTYVFLINRPAFFREQLFLVDDGKAIRLPLPDDFDFRGVLDGRVLGLLRSDWLGHGAGALIAVSVASLRGDDVDAVEEVIAPSERTAIAGVSVAGTRAYVSLIDNVRGRLSSVRPGQDGWERDEVPLPDNGSVSVISQSVDTDRAYVNFSEFLEPDALYALDGHGEPRRIKSLPARFDSTPFAVEQRFAKSSDGVDVPYFVVRPKELELDGTAPTVVNGYGGFEISMTPDYLQPTAMEWIERGGVYVTANIRGGGEFGPQWHEAALKRHRQRAFDDFIAVAEDLIAARITSPAHLGIMGGSNGGLLVGAAFTQRPELYGAVICAVPLLDMLRYHKLLAGASWMAEYGDPDVPEERAWISTYSPYQNVVDAKSYPEVFFTTSTKDDRVHPGHARKMAAKMLDQGHPILYFENLEGGHSAAANLKQVAHRVGLWVVYLLQKLAD